MNDRTFISFTLYLKQYLLVNTVFPGCIFSKAVDKIRLCIYYVNERPVIHMNGYILFFCKYG